MIKHLKLALLILVISSMKTYATHILGGEITYKYLGSNGPASRPFRYLIRFVGYVDQRGSNPLFNNQDSISNWSCGNLQQSPYLAIYSGDNNQPIPRIENSTDFNRFWLLPSHGPQQSSFVGTCPINPFYGGIRPLVIPVPTGCVVQGLTSLVIAITDTTFEVQLPLSASGYKIKFENLARTKITTNINFDGPDPGNTWLAEIPSPIFVNSSPQFIGDAVPFFCLGDTATISNNAFDPDGDRLIYSFATPYGGDGGGLQGPNFNPKNQYETPDIITYKSGFSQSAPFGQNGYAFINPSTGLTRYFASAQGQYAIAINIQEYRTLSNGTEILLSTTRRELLIIVKPCNSSPPPTILTVLNPNFPINTIEGDSIVYTVKSYANDSSEITAFSELLVSGNPAINPAFFPSAKGKDTIQSTFRWKIPCGFTKGQTRSYSVLVNYTAKGCPPKTETRVYTINVSPFKAPVISGKDSICSTGSSLTLSAPAGSDKQWKMLAGNILGGSTGNSVNVSFPGDTARLRLVVTSGSGCKDSTSKKLTKVQFVPIVASTQSAFICQDSSISLNALGGYNDNKWTPTTGLSSINIRNPKATPTDTISYVITSTGPAGCIAKDTVNLKWIPKIANAGPDSILCSGLRRGIGANQATNYQYYTYQWLPAMGLSSDTSFKTIATLSNTGSINQISTFVQRARHRASNCLSTDTVRINVKPLPVVNAGNTDPAIICSGGKTILGTPESASAVYQWSPVTGVLNPTRDTTTVTLSRDSLNAQFYTYYLQKTEVVISPLPGEPACTNRDSITVRVNPLPFFNLATKDSICSGLSTNIGTQNQSGFNYQWSPSRGLTNGTNAQTGISLINLSQNPGDTLYKLLVTNSLTGCKREKSLNIRINPLPIVNAGTDAALCSGDTIKIGEANQAGFGYSWTPVNGLIASTISNPGIRLLNPNVGGSSQLFQYKLTKENSVTKCKNADSLNVKVKPLPTVDAGPPEVTICSGQKTILGTAESVSAIYQWTPSNGLLNPARDTTSVSLNPDSVAVQFYTYKVKKTEGIVLPGEPACSNVDSIKLRVNPLPFFSLASKDSLCSGLSTTIGTANQIGFVYQWTPSSGLNTPGSAQTNVSLTNLTQIPGDTIYNLLVTNGQSSCNRAKTINIRVNPLPIVNAGIDTALCSGDSIRIGELSQNGFAYAWTPLTGLGSGINSSPNISLINGNVGGASQTFPYKITKLNITTTCRKADSLNVTVKPLPIAIAAASDTVVVCSKSNLSIGSNALTNHLYVWTPDSALGSSTISNPTVNINNPSQAVTFANYKLGVTNSVSRCKNADSVTVKINPLPIVPLVYADTAVCSRDSINIGGFFTSGYSYSWSPRVQLVDSSLSLAKFSAVNNTDNPVSYLLNLQVRINATNCINNKPLNVVVNPLPDANAGLDKAVCSGDSIQIGIAPAAGRQYSWTPITGLSNPNVANPKFSLPNSGNFTIIANYTLSVVDNTKSTRCDSSDVVSITIKPLPNVVAAASDSIQICSTLGLNLGISGETDLNYQWTPATNLSSGTVSNPVFTSNTSTGGASLLYILTATSTVSQCIKADSVHIQVNALPGVTVGSVDSLCSGDTVTIGPGFVILPNTYQWTPSTGFVGGNSISPALTLINDGTTVTNNPYKLIVTSIQTGCKDSATLNVRVNPLPQVNAGVDRAICSGSSTELGAGSQFGFGYDWQTNAGLTFLDIGNPLFTMSNLEDPKNDTLILTMTNSTSKCKKSDAVIITTNPRPKPVIFGLFSPTVCPFTQNVNYLATNSLPGHTYNWEVSGGSQSAGTNTNAINVNWGGPNQNAKIYTTPTNVYGCVGNRDSIRLAINSNLTPVKPFGDTLMCSFVKLNKLYATVPTPGSNYKWKFLNPTLDSATTALSSTNIDWNTNDGITKIWIQEQSSTVDPITNTPIKCFGRSDTLFVRINPSPDSSLSVLGNGQVCGSISNQEVFNLNGKTSSTYNWIINPSVNIVTGQGTRDLTVNWNTPGNYFVQVTETSDKGCVGRPISKPVEVNVLPMPRLAAPNLNICPNDLVKGYSAVSAPGFSNSTYKWIVTGGKTINDSTDFLAVEWDKSGVYELKLTETTSKGCKKDTVFQLQYDASALELQNVSLLENDENQVELKFNMSNQNSNTSFISILRRELSATAGTYDTVQARIPRNISNYIDQPGATGSLAYQYLVVSKNICNKVIESFPKNTILLNVAALQQEGGAQLTWNPFNGWPNGVKEYSVLRRIDKEQALSPYDSEQKTEAFYRTANEGFEQCFRVIANEKDGDFKSFSNTVCVKFLNPLEFYNLITPNGDTKNDKFEIKNLHLYPENELRISDRWGNEIYKRTGYNNSDLWDGSNKEGDVFFFKFTLTNTGQEFNGWVTVARK